jgi:anti-sigma factor RsiW
VSEVGRITCRELVGIVTEYLEGTLDADDRARFESHIGRCAGCRAYLDQVRKTIAMTGRLSEDDIAPSMRDTLLGAFRDWKARPAGGG